MPSRRWLTGRRGNESLPLGPPALTLVLFQMLPPRPFPRRIFLDLKPLRIAQPPSVVQPFRFTSHRLSPFGRPQVAVEHVRCVPRLTRYRLDELDQLIGIGEMPDVDESTVSAGEVGSHPAEPV